MVRAIHYIAGHTPKRTDYRYPRSLTKAVRHSSVLEEFRKDYDLQEAMETPIPDDSLNSSYVRFLYVFLPS